MRYLILTTPRSRSAWLSLALTHGPSWCLHEALVEAGGPFGLPRLLAELDAPHAGACGSDLGPFYPQLRRLLPVRDNRRLRLVVVERDTDEWVASLERLGWPCPEQVVDATLAGLRAAEADGALRVRWHDLDDRAAEVYAHCTGERPDPSWRRRLRMLQRLNVQLIPERELDYVREHRFNDVLRTQPWLQ